MVFVAIFVLFCVVFFGVVCGMGIQKAVDNDPQRKN